MDIIPRAHFDNIYSDNRELQHAAFMHLLESTEMPVTWAYEVWDELVNSLQHKNNRVRAIASQVLINLSKSDPDKKILKDFDALLNVTKDERFVTARHCLQALWMIGLVGQEQRALLLNGLESRFYECATEKNCTLIRYDIIQGFRNLYNEAKDEKIKVKALELIETEEDLKYRKKYASVWNDEIKR